MLNMFVSFILLCVLLFLLYNIKYTNLIVQSIQFVQRGRGNGDDNVDEYKCDLREDEREPNCTDRYLEYDPVNGDCTGKDLGVTPRTKLNESDEDFLNRCMDECDNNPKCKGFSYNFRAKRCPQKSVDCNKTPYGRKNNGYTFYYKP